MSDAPPPKPAPKPAPIQASTIAEPDERHWEAMADLFQQGQAPHHERFPEHFGPAQDRAAIIGYLKGFGPLGKGLRSRLRGLRRPRTNFTLGWFVDGHLSGYLLYQLYENANVFYGKSRWVCFVEDIVIDSKTRGMGGASILIGALIKRTEPLDDCMLSATVWEGNDASEALFKKHGFTPLSRCFYRPPQ